MIQWLERDLVVGPYLVLCTSQASFDEVLTHLKKPPHPYLNEGAHATTHHFGRGDDGGIVCVVCIAPMDHDPIAICALLVHEAVHVWQEWCGAAGEREPSAEFEAYSIQSIAGRLMWAYREQVINKEQPCTQSQP